MVLVTAAGAAEPSPSDSRDADVFLPILNDMLETQRTGMEVPWSNPETGRSGTLRIERTHYRGQQPCRDFTRTTEGRGASSEFAGTGCRVAPGRWDVLEREQRTDAAPAAPERPRPDVGGASPPPADVTAGTAAKPDDVVAAWPVPARKPPTYTLPKQSQL
ncbi:RT0821/Lpp0805 family surface protein [Arenibaculum pallidiluteum]|uniref:RT0821/Lpp0805 family surface protein n=1 Tax=Arenibaculum pallidiluteum TaxID=2812559 RepID=UPI001A96285C|nr:RT0821/Lpp0805 family surface protein [Arenibaculum pallidiluteum]